MDDFPGLLARDFGFKPQGKSAPMAPSRNNNLSAKPSSSNFGLGSNASEFTKSSSLKSNAVFDDDDRDGLLFNDVFGGPPKYSSTSAVDLRSGGGNTSSFDYDSIFRNQNAKSQNSKSNSMPVFDKPVYDDDIFEGLPGLKSSSATEAAAASPGAKFDDVFSSILGSPPKQRSERQSSPFDDLLGNLGKKETESRVKPEKNSSAFDDLLPGFGRSSSPSSNRSASESTWSQKPPSNSTKTASSAMEDPFVVLESTSTTLGSSSEVFSDPLEEIGKFGGSGSAKVNGSSVRGGAFDDLDPLTRFGKSMPPVSPEFNKRGKDRSPLRSESTSGTQTHPSKESIDRSSVENSDSYVQNRTTVDGFQESNETFFDMRNVSTNSHRSTGQATSPPSYMSGSPHENSQIDPTPKSEEIFESDDDVWLTISEIPVFTQPTSAPPPSRPAPPRPISKSGTGSANARKMDNEYSSSFSNSSQYTHSPKSARAAARSPVASQIDELEDFAMGRSWNNVNEYDFPSGEDVENSIAAASAAAMKEAMDRAEAKFRHAKEMRERESSKAARIRECVQLDKDERFMSDAQEREQERLDRERILREKEEEEQRRLEREREEKEREQRRLQKERERAREIEKERAKARQAVERATREARERAAAEARLKAERAAVDKANAAARERAERAAVQRAQAEARERAAAEARERAERVAAEARERANAEAREKEVRERAAATRAAERAAVEAQERAAAAARANQNQQKNDSDLESFFSMNSRPSSAPRPRANSSVRT